MSYIEKTIHSLPPEAKKEVIDFIEFIVKKYERKKSSNILKEKIQWLKLSEQSLNKIWNNEEDDVYSELLKR